MKKQAISFVKNWFVPIGGAFVLAFLINKFLFFNIEVPSESMYPTIKIGDRLLVTRVYKPSNLDRGDLVVFNSNQNNDKLIKRLIGFPGEEIEIKEDGSVYIDGEKLDESYVKHMGGPTSLTFNVPEDCYFFLGDNRENSEDARYWDNPYITSENIIGKAQITIYPFNRFGKV